MSNYYGSDDELRSITFRDEDGEDGGDDRYYQRLRPGGRRGSRVAERPDPYARGGAHDDGYGRADGYADGYGDEYGRARADGYADDYGDPYAHADPRDPRDPREDPSYDPYDRGYGYDDDPRYGDDSRDRYDDRYGDQYGDQYGRYDERYGDQYDDGYRDQYGARYGDRYDDRYADGSPYDADPDGPQAPTGALPLGRYGRPSDRRRNRTKTTLLILLALVLMLGGGLVLTGYLISENIAGKTAKEETFSRIPEEQRAQKPTTGPGKDALNILLAGTDARESEKSTGAGKDEGARGGKRSDTIIIVHITADRKHAYLISIPRDAWVEIPGQGEGKINSAYALGGSSLYVRTIENLTDIRMDHYASIGWLGFQDLTDALGGVRMDFPKETKLTSGRVVPAGSQVLSGEEALDYVRMRKGLQNGDFDRIKRQQNFLRALMRQTLSSDTLTNPAKLTQAISAVAENLTVDEGLDGAAMRSLATQMAGLRASDVTFMTAPLDETNPTPTINGQSTVALDKEKCRELFRAVKEDRTGEWLAKNEADTLGEEVN